MLEPLETLGFDPHFHEAFRALNRPDLRLGRVVESYLDQYTVHDGLTTYRAELTGNLRFSFEERADYPTTGDWVAMAAYDDQYAVIHAVLPRRTVLARRAASMKATVQLIAANIDVALVVQAAGRDFNLNRLDRYLALCHAGGILPVAVLSKTDLIDAAALSALIAEISARHAEQQVLAISSVTDSGLDGLHALLEPGKTFCVLGSSGVGKSTLINRLRGNDALATRAVNAQHERGRHTTTGRTLIRLPSGALMIDTPGMRELGMVDAGEGLEKTFDDIYRLASSCRFGDCQHAGEPGCAVQAAIDSGELSAAKFENYLKMQRESAHFEASTAERRQKARRQGRLYKRIQREKRRH